MDFSGEGTKTVFVLKFVLLNFVPVFFFFFFLKNRLKLSSGLSIAVPCNLVFICWLRILSQ